LVGIIIPILKNPDGNQYVTNNYRGPSCHPAVSGHWRKRN